MKYKEKLHPRTGREKLFLLRKLIKNKCNILHTIKKINKIVMNQQKNYNCKQCQKFSNSCPKDHQ